LKNKEGKLMREIETEYYPFVYYDRQRDTYCVFPKREVEYNEIEGGMDYELVIIISCEYINGKLQKIDFGELYFPTMVEAIQYAFTLKSTIMFRPKNTRKLIPITTEEQAVEAILNCTDADYEDYNSVMGPGFYG
jgi:hypothetical protein